jgi:cytoskeletal protein CcmA (bactofilin family)
MTNIGKGLVVTGTVFADEAVSIGGTVKGDVVAAGHAVTIEKGGRLEGNATVRTMTIGGTFVGRLIAVQQARLRRTAWVRSSVATPSICIEEGAIFNGSVAPARLEAALRVAAYRRKA